MLLLITMINYYTDGSCSPNPGPGGFAAVKDTELVIVGSEDMSTNIRMEGLAIISALKDADNKPCNIYSDSEFWVNVLNKWSHGWKANNWIKKNGDIKNLDLVKEAHDLYHNSKAHLIWVKGHVGKIENEVADDWANRAREHKLSGSFLSSEADKNFKK